MVEELRTASNKVDLEINLSKTKVVFNRNLEIQPIMTGNVALDQVDRYAYLGQLISIHRDWEPEVRRRVALDVDYITAENFMYKLDNGVIVCKLAKLIQTHCEQYKSANNQLVNKKVIPKLRFKVWENAKSGSFFARENTENFLTWCKKFGVHEAVIFESDDLVSHSSTRIVVLCLLELGRIASKFNIEPPGLIKLEKEIDKEIDEQIYKSEEEPYSPQPLTCDSVDSADKPKNSSKVLSSNEPTNGNHVQVEIEMLHHVTVESCGKSRPAMNYLTLELPRTPSPAPMNKMLGLNDSFTSESNMSIQSTTSSLNTTVSGSSCGDGLTSSTKRRSSRLSELDRKVLDIADCCGCDKDRLQRVSEGKYCIGGRNVFVRLLKGRHVMVRVGGGWDTLEHFLSRHDPHQVIVMNRKGSASEVFTDSDPFLHIKAKYRGSCTPINDNNKAKTPTTPSTPKRLRSRPNSSLYASYDHLA
ncbi:Growth arrest-specific protein 2 [Nymphon striatum]|nr:Growth arrest-specific protein 2 [Nymphon striatum]